MTHFPLFFNLNSRLIIIFGGDHHALQKIRKLMPFSPEITVISENIIDEITEIDGINIIKRKFRETDLDSYPLFVITTEPVNITEKIYKMCKIRHIPVNAVDMPEYCDIIFPSVISKEHICIGISSDGTSPTATVELKERVDDMLPEGIDSIIEWMPYAKSCISEQSDSDTKKAVLRKIFKKAFALNRPLTPEELKSLL